MKRSLLLLFAAITLAACEQGGALITDKATRDKVNAQIKARKSWLPAIPKDITPEEADAMRFLYAYMPVGDIADYDQSLVLANIRSSLLAKAEMSWGDSIPEDIFLHFVLPIRSNNETLDTSRSDFYAELKERIRDMSMYDAILEVNRWCHEKVVYSSTDGRTFSPSATVKTAFGRCGEEAPFTVAALRAAGIPARLIYTPRWAHTDDNHAWVEAWADGQWYFLGACEPDAALNSGWFVGPASRGLLMHSRVFGDYGQADEVIDRSEGLTEINVTHHYAPVSEVTVKVLDKTGRAVEGANVIFSIYNYAELYPAVRKTTGQTGTASLSAGRGTMVVWANDGADFGYELFRFGTKDTLAITLDKRGRDDYSVDFDLVPPDGAPGDLRPMPATDEQRAENGRRMRRGDSTRRAYVATFMDEEGARKLARDIETDEEQVWKFISTSRGNWMDIEKFLRSTPKVQLPVALRLLDAVSTKDLRDTPAEVLENHLQGAAQYADRPFFAEYILNPRIANELLTPYRLEFGKTGEPGDVEGLISRARNVQLRPELNPQRLSITPMGVHKLGIADMPAVERYAIALIRSHGIPARREPITLRPQYYDLASEKWVNIKLSDSGPEPAPRGTFDLKYEPADPRDGDPQYYARFTMAKLTGGEYRTVDMSSTVAADMGAGISYRNLFKQSLELEEGEYTLTTGTRLGDGTVLCKLDFFNIEPGRQTGHEMTMRQESMELEVMGSLDPASLILPEKTAAPQSVAKIAGKNYFILAVLEPKKEPTNHAMRDIAGLKGMLDHWGGKTILLLRNEADARMFDRDEFGELSSGTVFATDWNGETMKMLTSSLKLENPGDLPLILIANTDGEVVFLSQGYTIGVGRQIFNTLRKISFQKEQQSGHRRPGRR